MLGCMGHLLTEDRHGLVVDVELAEANGCPERVQALQVVERGTSGRATLGADRGYKRAQLRRGAARALGVTPHVASNDRRWGAERWTGGRPAPGLGV